jgi:hypothetical protein
MSISSKISSPSEDDIEVSECYDKDADVYYVTVMTGEPSIVEEQDDRLLVEIGIFTGLPTGFRILNYSKHKNAAHALRDAFRQVCKKMGLRKIKNDLEVRHRRIDKFFEKAIA